MSEITRPEDIERLMKEFHGGCEAVIAREKARADKAEKRIYSLVGTETALREKNDALRAEVEDADEAISFQKGEIERLHSGAALKEAWDARDKAEAQRDALLKALRLFTGHPYVGGYCVACGGPQSLDDHADDCRYGIAAAAIKEAGE